jgi:uncharacterized hydrophobic protein (TIGR00271 family)
MEYSDFRILAAIGEQDQLLPLLTFACALVKEQQGAVTVLCVTPDGERPEWLRLPEQCADVAIRVVVHAGDDASGVILAAAHDLHPNLLLVGWRGTPGPSRYLLGSTLDPVTRYAPCDVAVLRLGELHDVHRVLVPMSSGPNAPLAIEIALRLPHTEITALNIVRESLGPAAEGIGHSQLRAALGPWAEEERITAKVVRAPGIIDGIVAEAAGAYDLVFIGATNQSYIDRKLFGNVPQAVATDAPVPTVVVRRHAGPVRKFVRRAQLRIWRVQGSLTLAEHAETYRTVRDGSRARPDFFVLVAMAAAVATLGLLMDSPAVIIGAMVIAPLMSAILGISLGVAQGDMPLLWQAAKATLLGAGLVIAVAALVTAVIPDRSLTAEILARVQPSLLDLGVALAAGIVAVYAHCRREMVGALAGVAIAVALVPPLAAIGIGLTMLDGTIAGGATLQFLTNLSAIVAAGAIVFLLFGFRADPGERFRVFSRSMIGVIALLLIVSGALTVLTIDSVRSTLLEREVQAALTAELRSLEGVELLSWEIENSEEPDLGLRVRVQTAHTLSREQVSALQEQVVERLGRPLRLRISVVPVTQYDLPAQPLPVTPNPD